MYVRRKNRGNCETGIWNDQLSFKAEEEEENGEGLSMLIPNIQATARIVEVRYEYKFHKTNFTKF